MIEIFERIDSFMSATGSPVTEFCKRVNISPQTYYRWRKNQLKLKDSTIERMKKFVEKFNF